MLYKDLQFLQKNIYEDNVKAGWWDSPRSISVICNLFHSEVSEAMEGIRKNLLDDKLTEHEMFKVEVSDYVIRILDYLGSINYNWVQMTTKIKFNDRNDFLDTLHNYISLFSLKNNSDYLAESIIICFNQSKQECWNLRTIIEEKREFNKNREDHKRENRSLENGKKF